MPGRRVNREEARTLVLARLETFLPLGREELAARIGREDVAREVGASGVAYFVEVSVEEDDLDGSIEVIGYASEVGGRWFLPPTESASFVVTPDGRIVKRGGW